MSLKQLDDEIAARCVEWRNDPSRLVRWMYPWGEGGLEGWKGPDWWHEECFAAIKGYYEAGDFSQPLQIAVASGNGAAKTTFIAWLIRWFMETRPDPQVVVTANTEQQLKNKTWRELAKWHGMALDRHQYEWAAESYQRIGMGNTWRATAVPWSAHNTQAFAGTHEKHVLLVFDESSDIIDGIWEQGDGNMTTPGAMWVAVGNPMKSSGRFWQTFHDERHSKWWWKWNVDSRTCKAANRPYLDRLIEQYGGEEDDRARSKVLGLFPIKEAGQLISRVAVEKAMKTECEAWEFSPLVMGVDIARSGSNESEIALRRGRKVFPIIRVPKAGLDGDLMAQASFIADVIRRERPAVVCVDASGVGGGVVDRLRQLNFSVVGVNAGNSSINPRFLNKRAEMWWGMKEFIEGGGCELPKDKVLQDHLCSVGYDYTDKGRIRLERKEDVIEAYGFSPDRADALSFTFSYPVYEDASEGLIVDPPVFEDS